MVLVSTAIVVRVVAYVFGGAASSPGRGQGVEPGVVGDVGRRAVPASARCWAAWRRAGWRWAVDGGGSVEAWMNPTSVVVGLVAVALAAFEGAVHLASEASRYDDVRLEHFLRHRAVWRRRPPARSGWSASSCWGRTLRTFGTG